MCCRYYIDRTEELEPVIEEMNRSPLLSRFEARGAKIITAGEVRPSNVAPALATSRNGGQGIFPMKFGFAGKPMMINARSETAAVRPLFREAWAGHRCAIPACWYEEWEHLPQPDGRKKTGPKYRIHPKDAKITWLCGLYRIEEGLPAFVILTREPADEIRFIHDRMPMMLPEEWVEEWIRPQADPSRLLESAQTEMTFHL